MHSNVTSQNVSWRHFSWTTLYTLQAEPPTRRWSLGKLPPPTIPLDGPGCVNNVLINAFKKLTQCINALKN